MKLSKPYNFEGKEYTEIDLSGLESLTGKDMEQAETLTIRMDPASSATVLKELNASYTMAIASIATGLPMEFFESLPIRDAANLKYEVADFIMPED